MVLSNDEEFLSEDCQIRTITVFEQEEELAIFNFEKFNFQKKTGLVTVFCLTKDSFEDDAIFYGYEEEQIDSDDENDYDENNFFSSIGLMDEGFSNEFIQRLEQLGYKIETCSEDHCCLTVRKLNDFLDFSWFTQGDINL